MLSGLSLGMTGAPGSAVVAGRLRQGERPCDKWVEGSIVEVWGMIRIPRLFFFCLVAMFASPARNILVED